MAFLLYDTASGALVTSSSLDPSPPYPSHLTLVDLTPEQYTGLSSGELVWDPVARALQPRPVDITITVSANLRTKIEQRLDEFVQTGLPAVATARTTAAGLKTVNLANVGQAQAAIRSLAGAVETGLVADDKEIRALVALFRLFLGDYYGDTTKLQSEAGSDGA